jgi:hypothetical protein
MAVRTRNTIAILIASISLLKCSTCYSGVCGAVGHFPTQAKQTNLESRNFALLDLKLGENTVDDAYNRLGPAPMLAGKVELEICYRIIVGEKDSTIDVAFDAGPLDRFNTLNSFEVKSDLLNNTRSDCRRLEFADTPPSFGATTVRLGQ